MIRGINILLFIDSLVGSCLLDIAWLWFTCWKLMNPSFFFKKIPNIVSMVSAMVFQQGLFNYFQQSLFNVILLCHQKFSAYPMPGSEHQLVVWIRENDLGNIYVLLVLSCVCVIRETDFGNSRTNKHSFFIHRHNTPATSRLMTLCYLHLLCAENHGRTCPHRTK